MPTNSSPRLMVACLCAQWCGTCREYQPLFDQLQAEFPHTRFLWVDVEDESDLVDPVDVENFPTVLIARGEQALFFGTLTPHLETLRRLIQNHIEPSTSAATALPEAIGALTQRLNHHA